MADVIDYKLPGQFIYDGMIFCGMTSRDILEKVKVYPLTKDDILISTYPKAGTRWMQEILWLIMNDAKLSQENIRDRVPFIEYAYGGFNGLESLRPGPKLVKTHLPYSYFATQITGKKTRVIVFMRNIRDTLVSYFKFYQMNGQLGNFPGNWDDYFTLFKQKRLLYGDWLEFNLEWWGQRHLDNVLIVFYEDMKENPKREISRIFQFCGKNHSEDTISTIANLTTFEIMKANPATNNQNVPFLKQSISPFIRKGEVGDWKNYFNQEQLAYLREEYEPKLNTNGLTFRYEI